MIHLFKTFLTIIEEFASRFLIGSILVYVGDTGDKWAYFETEIAKKIEITLDHHGKMPDVIFYLESKNWLILVGEISAV